MNAELAENCEDKMAETYKLISGKLGEVEFTDEDIITMSSPILGFPDLHDFLLISSEKSFPFIWLQSTEDHNICFILIEPKMFHTDYNPRINKRELKILGADSLDELKLFGIVVVPDDPQGATVNLRAPILINTEKKLAKQLVLDDEKWQIKAPLFKNKEK